MKLHKLKGNRGYTTFGSMWEKGTVSSESDYVITSENGEKVPCQSEITAYWPDGSVKWTAHTADSEKLGESFIIEPCEKNLFSDEPGIRKSEDSEGFTINNGVFEIRILKMGSHLFEAITQNGKLLCANAAPELILQEPVTIEDEKAVVNHNFTGYISEAVIEEEGKLRTIVRFVGTHVDKKGLGRLAFIIRMCIDYASAELKFTHTFVYDGDENKDFLKGIGVVFESPIEGSLYNRHIKFTGDNGVFHESVVTLQSWHPRVPLGMDFKQMEGEKLQPEGQALEDINAMLAAMPYWDEYSICQDSVNHFGIRKKLYGDDFCYIDALHGNRAAGGLAVGGENGSVLVGMTDFWEKYPSGYQIKGFSRDSAEIHIWLWSPDAEAMDFRHYTDRGYNSVCYEGYDYKGADPYGIACTNEFTIAFCKDIIPSDDVLLTFAKDCDNPTVYVASPEDYHALHAFGDWSLENHDSEVEKWLESQLEKAFEFYKNEVSQRNWYGMFNYGDFMHTYDISRHVWRYDVGGYAWDNTELVPTLWLWFYFLRTGREDVFRLAEKLTRHSSEVDVYHIGKYKGMGSRHNVRHWGCPCKEARIAMAHHHRVYYYLTGDKRLEDIFDELKDNEATFMNRDPLGDFYDKANMVYPSHARSGPDWSSLCSNWMTRWERTNDKAYLDKILVGMEDIKKAPLRLVSGPDFEFDPETLHLRYIGERTTGGTHLQICMGAPSIWMEMADLMEDEEWKDMLAELGSMYFMTREEQFEKTNGLIGKRQFTFPMFAGGLGSFAAKRCKDETLKKKVWKTMFSALLDLNDESGFEAKILKDKANLSELKEIPWISTNYTAQFCLNVIIALEFIRDGLPENMADVRKMISEDDVNKNFRQA